jgi:hypothetical protein
MITYRYVDFPNLKEIAKQILEILPDLHKDTNVYKSYDKDFFFKIKPLVESVEKFKPWNDMFQQRPIRLYLFIKILDRLKKLFTL